MHTIVHKKERTTSISAFFTRITLPDRTKICGVVKCKHCFWHNHTESTLTCPYTFWHRNHDSSVACSTISAINTQLRMCVTDLHMWMNTRKNIHKRWCICSFKLESCLLTKRCRWIQSSSFSSYIYILFMDIHASHELIEVCL